MTEITWKEKASGFFVHGVEKEGRESGNQFITSCRFCGRTDKFYINQENLLWDCKVCGRSGNYLSFLKQVAEQNHANITEDELKKLAKNRGLPMEAFGPWEIGYDGSKYTMPMYDYDGNLTDLKMYTLGHQIFGSKHGKQSLIGGQYLKESEEDTVYLCEGQWDTYAMAWLLDYLKKPGIAVGVPGASNFNEDWIEYFFDKKVFLCYDNDEAGKKGESKAYGLLTPVARSVQCLHWPSSKPDGYDLRDLIRILAVKKNRPRVAFKRIHKLMEAVPRSVVNLAGRDESGNLTLNERRQEKLKPITFDEMVAVYRKWLHIPDITPIRVMFATIFANRLPGEMLWMFLVGAPSSLKTELIRSLGLCPEVEMVSTLTPHTLVSGFIAPGKKDTSLLPLLNNRILAIKDYTSILSMNAVARDEIHGQLRDVYDGKLDKLFGHGVHRRWKGKFGILAAVTATIEKFGLLQQTLGERFLRYVLPKETDEETIMAKMRQATSNVTREDEMRDEISFAVKRYLSTFQPDMPTMDGDIGIKIQYLSRFTALLRGFVDRDYHGTILYRPDMESPMRLGKQLFKLGLGLASVEGRTMTDENDYRILRDVAVGTCPGRIESIVRVLYELNRPAKLRDIVSRVRFDLMTVRTVLNDLIMLNLIRLDGGYAGYYSLSDLCKHLIDKGNIYQRPMIVSVPKVTVRRSLVAA